MPKPQFTVRVEHPGLGKVQVYTGTDRYVVEQRASERRRQWEEQWQRVEQRRIDRESKESLRAQAEELTECAARDQRVLATILQATLSVNDAVDWDRLKSRGPFEEPAPVRPAAFAFPKPDPESPLFRPRRTLAQRIFPWKAKQARREQVARYQRALAEWERFLAKSQADHAEFQRAASRWNDRKAAFLEDQAKRNAAIDTHRTRFEAKDPEAITDYFELVLNSSRYPEGFP